MDKLTLLKYKSCGFITPLRYVETLILSRARRENIVLLL